VGLFPFRAGAHAAADALRRALGVLWLADALVKILLPFGDRPGEQSYEQVMAAETGPPGLHHVLAQEASTFAAHPFLWWLPAAVELRIGAWLVARPASRRALAASAGWALVVWVADGAACPVGAGGHPTWPGDPREGRVAAGTVQAPALSAANRPRAPPAYGPPGRTSVIQAIHGPGRPGKQNRAGQAGQQTGRLLITGVALSIDNLAAGFALGTCHVNLAVAPS
jgi:hypothetical protein